METKDLTSYKSGYDEHCEGAKVPFEDYRKLEDKIEIYEKSINAMKDALEENCSSEQKVKFIESFIVELDEELGKC